MTVELDDDQNFDENGGGWILDVLALPSKTMQCFYWVPVRCLDASLMRLWMGFHPKSQIKEEFIY